MIEIQLIKTGDGYFYGRTKGYQYSGSGLGGYLVNGQKPENTFSAAWFKLNGEPKLVQSAQSENINHRYELTDPSLKSDKIPEVIPYEDLPENLESLYELKYDRKEILKDREFCCETILEIDKIEEYAGFSYPVQKTQWESDGYSHLTEKDIQHEPLDEILFPDIILPARNSKLTSLQTYNVIRKHVKDNIDRKYALISSDYNFCFTVKKRIELAKKEPYRIDVNASPFGRKRKEKWETRYKTARDVVIFEMTHSGEGGNYKGYTPITPFEGRNLGELRENIAAFLAELMEKINDPWKECSCCDGLGVIKPE